MSDRYRFNELTQRWHAADSNRMVSFTVLINTSWWKLAEAAQKGNFENLRHAAASLSRLAKSLIRTSRHPSSRGQPPTTRRGLLRRSIRYYVDRQAERAYIGPIYSLVGTAGYAHEHGGVHRGQRFEKRPFMGPALDAITPRLAGRWRGTI